MDALTFGAAAVAWGLLPGLLLLWLARTGWSRVERAAAAAGLSPAVVAFAAYAAELIGLPIRPLPVAAVILVLCAAVFALRRRPGGAAPAAEPGWPADRSSSRSWAPWLVFLLPLAIVAQLEPMTSGPLLPPPLHDGLDHANWFRLIYELGSLNPHVVLAPPLDAAGAPTYYPWGMHAWVALLAQTTTLDPVTVLMWAMVLISAILPLSVYVFTAQFTGRGWTAMAAALLSVVFWWVPYQIWGWGGYPLLAGAMAALPAARLALSAAVRRHPAGIAAAAACLAGLLLIHPSQLFVALILTAVMSAMFAASGLLTWRAAAPPILVFAAACAVLIAGGMLWQPLGDFLDKARAVSVVSAADPRYRSPIGPFFDTQFPFPEGVRTGLALLGAAGAVVAVIHPRLRPLIVLHLVFGALVLMARHQTWLTTLWYHLPERIWYAQAATLPALGAVGLAGAIQLVTRLTRRWVDLSRWQPLIWIIALWAVFAPMHKRFEPWAKWRLHFAAQQNPDLTITDRRVLADYAWISANVPRSEVLFNAPADWGLPLPFTGNRTVFWSGGYAIDPSTPWNDLVALIHRGDPYTSHAGAELSARGIQYVYAGRLSAALERRGRLPLDGDRLREAAGFEVLYESPTALILRAAEVRGTLIGLADSDRIRFESFYRMEEQGRHRWRWTGGAGRIFLNVENANARECFVRILGPAPGSFELRHNGVPLDHTGRGYRLPRAEGAPIELEIVSGTFVPQPGGDDDRVLGVQVTNIALACTP